MGLEIHAQLQSKSKLFSAAGNRFDSSANTQVALFDAAIPGTLPVRQITLNILIKLKL